MANANDLQLGTSSEKGALLARPRIPSSGFCSNIWVSVSKAGPGECPRHAIGGQHHMYTGSLTGGRGEVMMGESPHSRMLSDIH